MDQMSDVSNHFHCTGAVKLDTGNPQGKETGQLAGKYQELQQGVLQKRYRGDLFGQTYSYPEPDIWQAK